MDESKNGNWGGYRSGAGRKPKYASTKVMRVPEDYQKVIKALIDHLDETATLDGNYKAVESESVYLRSTQGKRQNISFKTDPIK